MKRAPFRPEYKGIKLFNADSSGYSRAQEAGAESLYFSGSKVLMEPSAATAKLIEWSCTMKKASWALTRWLPIYQDYG